MSQLNEKEWEKMEKLAALAVYGGVNVQPDQLVVINAPIEASTFVHAIAHNAWQAGAKDVIIRYGDEQADHLRGIYGKEEIFEDIPQWKADMLNDLAARGACFIHVNGNDPELMNDVDPAKMQKQSLQLRRATPIYRQGIENGKNAWTIVPWPNDKWAQKVYPDKPADEAWHQLLDDIFDMCRVNEQPVLENWKKHDASFQYRADKLNSLNLKKLHYKNKKGTDLMVTLPENYRFCGGGTTLVNGIRTYPNIPTEEIFAAPLLNGVDGTLEATMPLNYGGSLIDGFGFTFKNGKVIDFHADQGREILASLLNSGEGSNRLGEVALVGWGSPINAKGKIFYDTLFDENASCHFALGQAYPESVENGMGMSDKQLKEAGLNQADIHVDFMVGSKDLSIIGIDQEGKEIPVFENGTFTAAFDRPVLE